MALWFFSSLLLAIFGGLFFLYDPARVGQDQDYKTAAAGLFDACRKAAITEAILTPALGLAAPVDLQCNTTDLTKSAASGINVPGVLISVQKANLLDAAYTGRIVTTYIKPDTTIMNGIPQLEAVGQIRNLFGREYSTGYVIAGNATWNQIANGDTVRSKVPAVVTVGSIASFQIVN